MGGSTGTPVSSADSSKNLGAVGGELVDIAIYMLNDFYGKL